MLIRLIKSTVAKFETWQNVEIDFMSWSHSPIHTQSQSLVKGGSKTSGIFKYNFKYPLSDWSDFSTVNESYWIKLGHGCDVYWSRMKIFDWSPFKLKPGPNPTALHSLFSHNGECQRQPLSKCVSHTSSKYTNKSSQPSQSGSIIAA